MGHLPVAQSLVAVVARPELAEEPDAALLRPAARGVTCLWRF